MTLMELMTLMTLELMSQGGLKITIYERNAMSWESCDALHLTCGMLNVLLICDPAILVYKKIILFQRFF